MPTKHIYYYYSPQLFIVVVYQYQRNIAFARPIVHLYPKYDRC